MTSSPGVSRERTEILTNMSLTVVVKSAASLPNLERFSKSDPMAVLIFQGNSVTCNKFDIVVFVKESSTKLKQLIII